MYIIFKNKMNHDMTTLFSIKWKHQMLILQYNQQIYIHTEISCSVKPSLITRRAKPEANYKRTEIINNLCQQTSPKTTRHKPKQREFTECIWAGIEVALSESCDRWSIALQREYRDTDETNHEFCQYQQQYFKHLLRELRLWVCECCVVEAVYSDERERERERDH